MSGVRGADCPGGNCNDDREDACERLRRVAIALVGALEGAVEDQVQRGFEAVQHVRLFFRQDGTEIEGDGQFGEDLGADAGYLGEAGGGLGVQAEFEEKSGVRPSALQGPYR